MDYHYARSQINVIHELAAGKGVSSAPDKKREKE